MKDKIAFGKFEATCIVMTFLSTQLFLNLPRMMMETALTAAWILTVYISILAFVLFIVIARLYRRFEGMDLLDLGEHIGGNIGRIIVGVIVLSFFLYITPTLLREFSENMKIIALPESPISFVSLFFLIGMISAAYLGLEVILRYGAIIVPIITAAYLLIILGSVKYFDISRITPWLGSGPYEIFVKGMSKVSVFAGVILIYFLFPFIRTNKNFKAVGYASIGLSGLFFFIGVLAFSLVYQYPTGTESFLPIYQLTRLIEYGRFFQRLESIFLFVWAASALLHLSGLLYLIAYLFKKTFKLEYYKPLIIAFSIIVYTLSFFSHNLMSAIELEKFFRNYSGIVTFLLPIVLLIIARFVKKSTKKEARNV